MGNSDLTVLTQEFENHLLNPSWPWEMDPDYHGQNWLCTFDFRTVRHTKFRGILFSIVATHQVIPL
jgi:hypothetical protein